MSDNHLVMYRVFAGAAVVVLSSAAQAGPVLYVDDDAPPAGDGTAWGTAYRFLADALADASGGGINEIRVGQGTYTPDRSEANPDGSGECFIDNGGIGCPDPVCEAAVCAMLITCCFVQWDSDCADIALDVCTEARGATFQLINGVALMGGYAGIGAKNPDDRNTALFVTTLTGDLAGDDGPGDFENNAENSYHVTTGSGTDAMAVLDGFTVTAGNANGLDPNNRGAGMLNVTGSPTVTGCLFIDGFAINNAGGMFNDISSPSVSDCTFSGNVAAGPGGAGAGGGMFNDISSPTISNCTFSGNTSVNDAGGGMANVFGSSPIVTNCTFNNNTGALAGGGMFNNDSCPTVTNCTFSDNDAGNFGGGMHNGMGSNPTVTNCTFTENSATGNAGSGGGMANFSSSPTVTNCTFGSNFAQLRAGGMANGTDSNPTVTNCVFTANTTGSFGGGGMVNGFANPKVENCTFTGNSAFFGGGMENFNSSPTIVNCQFIDNIATGNTFGGGGIVSTTNSNPTVTNCTFSNNSANDGGAVATSIDSITTITNCILWNDSPNEIGGAVNVVNYSDVEGGFSGTGNIDVDPLFVDPLKGDYRLAGGSLCIDAGDNTTPGLVGITTDLDGNPRFANDLATTDTGNGECPIVDMGASEFPASCPSDVDCDGNVGITDFLALLAAWGTNPGGSPDIDGDGTVGIIDFLLLLANWGSCP